MATETLPLSPALRDAPPPRTEAQARVDRIARRLTAHVEAMARCGALDREIASELVAKIKATC